jgi:hypothetical protein
VRAYRDSSAWRCPSSKRNALSHRPGRSLRKPAGNRDVGQSFRGNNRRAAFELNRRAQVRAFKILVTYREAPVTTIATRTFESEFENRGSGAVDHFAHLAQLGAGTSPCTRASVQTSNTEVHLAPARIATWGKSAKVHDQVGVARHPLVRRVRCERATTTPPRAGLTKGHLNWMMKLVRGLLPR